MPCCLLSYKWLKCSSELVLLPGICLSKSAIQATLLLSKCLGWVMTLSAQRYYLGNSLLLCLHMACYRHHFSFCSLDRVLALAKCWKAGAHQCWVHAGWPEGEGAGNGISKMGSWNQAGNLRLKGEDYFLQPFLSASELFL